jgi:hypothetical protein
VNGERERGETRAIVGARVRAHAEECEQCASQPLALETLSALFARTSEPSEARASLSDRVLAAATPLLAANAAGVYRRRLVSGIALSLAPFPLLVFFNLYLLREAYGLLSTWLPAGLAAWFIVGYAAMLLLVCALIYASLPLLIVRAQSSQALGGRVPLPSGT